MYHVGNAHVLLKETFPVPCFMKILASAQNRKSCIPARQYIHLQRWTTNAWLLSSVKDNVTNTFERAGVIPGLGVCHQYQPVWRWGCWAMLEPSYLLLQESCATLLSLNQACLFSIITQNGYFCFSYEGLLWYQRPQTSAIFSKTAH